MERDERCRPRRPRWPPLQLEARRCGISARSVEVRPQTHLVLTCGALCCGDDDRQSYAPERACKHASEYKPSERPRAVDLPYGLRSGSWYLEALEGVYGSPFVARPSRHCESRRVCRTSRQALRRTVLRLGRENPHRRSGVSSVRSGMSEVQSHIRSKSV